MHKDINRELFCEETTSAYVLNGEVITNWILSNRYVCMDLNYILLV
jgi:hypothetical protein